MAESRALLLVADQVHALASDVDPRADAVLILEDRIIEVGRAADLRGRLAAERVLTLPGATLTPGFTDAHIHLTEWAYARSHADLAAAATPEDAAGLVARHLHSGYDEWVRGSGWNPHHWGGDYPDRALLDARLPDQPVVLQSHDLHALWVNGEALRRAGIDEHTPDPPGGRIVRDASGRATGVLLESAAQLVSRVVPRPAVEDLMDLVAEAQSELHRLGITGVHSFPGVHLVEPAPLIVLQMLREQGRLRLRVLQHIALEQLDDAIAVGLRSGFGDDWIRIGGVKMFLDGALGSRTARMREPYEGSDDLGIRLLDPDMFEHHVQRAASAGIAAVVHAIGDAAVDLALDVLVLVPHARTALPHRIEHVQCCASERFADTGRGCVVASVQPAHLISDWRAADRHWGTRARCAFAFRSLADAGATLAFGSDAPVEPVDPRRALYAAVKRQDLEGQPVGGWHPHERLSVQAALTGYTSGPAIAAGMGDRLGQLKPGALADIVAWDRDPLAIPASDLLAMRCVAALVGGRLVWRDI